MRLTQLLEIDGDLGGIPAENPPPPGQQQAGQQPPADPEPQGDDNFSGLADPVGDGGEMDDMDFGEPEVERDIGDLVSHPYMDWETNGDNAPMELAKKSKDELKQIQDDAEDRMIAIAAEKPSGLYLNNEYRRLRDMADFIDQLKKKEEKKS